MRSAKRRGVKEALLVTLTTMNVTSEAFHPKERLREKAKKSCLLLAASPEGSRLPGMDMTMWAARAA